MRGGYSTQRVQAQKIRTQADIVFCMDATGSMGPCFDAVRNCLYDFVDGLQTSAQVEFRLRLLAYRDRHDPNARDEPWHIHEFTSSVEDFRSQLAAVEPNGGGDDPESTLDALYMAIHSDWRSNRTHKTIVLLTDADTHPHLLPSTYRRPDNDIHRVIQDFQTLRHAMLFMVTPDYSAYKQLEKSMQFADRKIVANFVPQGDDRYEGLKGVAWKPLMTILGQTVSITSVAVSQDEGIS